ncbi:hypothetical protein GCM10025868_12100 [Angustibacter aerolatus]|uniref:NlpC/P60 domain-containing protein n=1 Tax=Angustibacter aerolatus TaxID=1162965 RepID=A0ABQ6JGJ1_9ACTN|nr:hypothetical protein [Angustibacter aerolatus]GMA85960.1 hypothetical protein GCM10025868_12100 [Angustibacter aerolatus]
MRLPRPTRSVRRRAAVAVTTALSAVLVAGTLTAAPAQAGVADRKKQVDRRVDDARDDLEDTAADLRQAYERLQSTQAQAPAARARLGRANQAVADAAARDREIGGRLAVAKAAVAKAEDDLAATARSTDDTHDALGGLARQAYQSGGFGEPERRHVGPERRRVRQPRRAWSTRRCASRAARSPTSTSPAPRPRRSGPGSPPSGSRSRR